jgi:hypothetical protein
MIAVVAAVLHFSYESLSNMDLDELSAWVQEARWVQNGFKR